MHQDSTHINISFSRGWIVTLASAALGLVLGILYVWSVIKSGIPDSWEWTNADKALPYAIMAIVFSFIMIPAGKLQDRFGPRPIIMIGGFLTGLGCIVAGLSGHSLIGYTIGFGMITGAGVGFGYSALTPATIKWFPPEKTGLTAGVVVAGTGMAPLPLAPLTAWLLDYFSTTSADGVIQMGVGQTMITLGIVSWAFVFCLAWFVYNPPVGFIPQSHNHNRRVQSVQQELTWNQVLRTTQFWLMFVMYFSGSSAGLVFIGTAAELGKEVLGELSFLAVIVIATGNTFGRLFAGIASDRIGRQLTLFAEFICQTLVIGLLYLVFRTGNTSWIVVLMVMFMIGLNYGANLAIFPALCKDYFGVTNFGLNYGCLFTAFGMAGLLMPWLYGLIKDITGKTDFSYFLMMGFLTLSAALALISRKLGAPSLNDAGGEPVGKTSQPLHFADERQ